MWDDPLHRQGQPYTGLERDRQRYQAFNDAQNSQLAMIQRIVRKRIPQLDNNENAILHTNGTIQMVQDVTRDDLISGSLGFLFRVELRADEPQSDDRANTE
ncbi:hypothetical protein M430DRAFT_268819 [Amorphotheca resinae ATCC 22711]|uniref:Uncharacterized protein n=1 Tax=Amorphotheca resinae ATCC 22711 TaxID=857342 RepID=A0A2T3BDX2_AMORE|nr:hypothetical protein M430DRAFT_268819 [Amorphotheca resinae ATCC 22711]PSS27574.1 hypothetical protein M430DRAFT_268819 [Amorphotheca resinae ATCC 22711]